MGERPSRRSSLAVSLELVDQAVTAGRCRGELELEAGELTTQCTAAARHPVI